jgi:hypothetical protein
MAAVFGGGAVGGDEEAEAGSRGKEQEGKEARRARGYVGST